MWVTVYSPAAASGCRPPGRSSPGAFHPETETRGAEPCRSAVRQVAVSVVDSPGHRLTWLSDHSNGQDGLACGVHEVHVGQQGRSLPGPGVA